MMVKTIQILMTLFFMEHLIMAQDVTQDVQVISERLKTGWIENRISQDRVQDYLDGLRETGGWRDIDYDDVSRTHWGPANHPARLAQLAEVYCVDPDETVKDAVLRGLQFWVDKDPQSDNWWWNCISSPRDLSKTLLLMGDVVSTDLVAATALLVHRSTFKRTGANLTNEASNLLVLACAIGDVDLLRESIAQLTGEIRVAIGEEGIQVDNSFHQHGPQLQMSSYAEVFARDATEHGLLFDGTQFALSDVQISALSEFVREGQQWFTWGHRVDFHGMGRGIGRTGGTGGAGGMRLIAQRMAQIDPTHKETYDAIVARSKDELAPDVNAPKGNRHYYRSDVMVHRPGHFHTSMRMHSTRTYGCEVRVNQENLKGYHVSDGAYFVMQSGDEYLDIQPVWDWRKLPGVTYRETDEPFPYGGDVLQHGKTNFVGGVSDGHVGVAAMDWVKDDVRARKAYFFFDEGFVCLGAGISAELDEKVATSVNQCLLNGDVLVLCESLTEMGRGRLEGGRVRGVHHDGIGYYFLGNQNVVVRSDAQTGSWKDLEANSKHKELMTKDVFSLWVDHGEQPSDGSYAYAVMPGMGRELFVDKAGVFPFAILKQTSAVQAVEFADQGLVQIAFFEAGGLQVLGGLDVEVNMPCLVMVQKEGRGLVLSVADPTQKLNQIQFKLDGLFEGDGAVVDGTSTVVTIDLPQDEWAGKTVQVKLQSH
jgi:chondroitin AC lyase